MSVIPPPPLVPTVNGRFYDICWTLARFVQAALANPPTYMYVAPGQVAHEFGIELIGVEWTEVRPGVVGSPGAVTPIASATPYTMIVVVTVTRGVPTIDDQGNIDLIASQQSAAQIGADAWQAMTAIHDGAQNSTLLNQAQGLAITGLNPIGPEGGLGGIQIHLEVEV